MNGNKEKFKFELKKYLKSCDIGIEELHEPSIVWIENYDTDELHIGWRKKPSNKIEDLLVSLKILDENLIFEIRPYMIYESFIDAGLDDGISRTLTRSFLKYLYEEDSWRCRMNSLASEWEHYLLNEKDIEKVKIALGNIRKEFYIHYKNV